MENRIGEQMIRWRRIRGQSQLDLATAAQVSQSYISKIESGDRVPDRRSTQLAIAAALNITVRQLLGGAVDSDDTDPVRDRALIHVPAIRSALLELTAGERRPSGRGVDELRAATVELGELRNAADYAAITPLLPGLLHDLAAAGPDVAPEMVSATFCARYTLKAIGFPELGMRAADLGMAAAGDYDSAAWAAQATYSWVQALPPEDAALGRRILRRAADDLQAYTDRDSREMYGCLHLLAAHSAAVTGDAAAAHAHLDEAGEIAATLGEPRRHGLLSAGFNVNWFGKTQEQVWRVAVAAELGDIGGALAVAKRIDLDLLPLPNRWVFYWTDLARVLAASDDLVAAMHALAKAEQAAPQHFRSNPVARNLVQTIIIRSQRQAVSADLRALAVRLGIHPL